MAEVSRREPAAAAGRINTGRACRTKATIEGISTTMSFRRHEYGPKDDGLKLLVIEKGSELTGGIEGTAVVR